MRLLFFAAAHAWQIGHAAERHGKYLYKPRHQTRKLSCEGEGNSRHSKPQNKGAAVKKPRNKEDELRRVKEEAPRTAKPGEQSCADMKNNLKHIWLSKLGVSEEGSEKNKHMFYRRALR
jgi:hypothetical protein